MTNEDYSVKKNKSDSENEIYQGIISYLEDNGAFLERGTKNIPKDTEERRGIYADISQVLSNCVDASDKIKGWKAYCSDKYNQE